MTDTRRMIHAIFALLAPIIVALLGWSIAAATALVLFILLWRWLIVMSGFIVPEKTPELQLESIAASHFVEKVRWSMDRLGVEYHEQKSIATLGAFYRGRTVPQLKMRTGAVRSVIGNSSEILRYLYGRYVAEPGFDATFLCPSPERAELEHSIDREGVNLQVWVYHHILVDRELALHAWGVNDNTVPIWQRTLLRLLFPVQAWLIRRSFRITDESFAKAVARIEAFLAEMNVRLEQDERSLSGDATPNYVDFAFAAINGLWLMPEGYGGGQADAVRIEIDRMPERMRMDVDSWRIAYPAVVTFIEALYRERGKACGRNRH